MSKSANFSSHHNVRGNNSNICSNFVVSKEIKITIHVFTLVVALVGNSLLIAAYKKIKEPLMLFIANMAASDLLTAIFLIPRLITIAIVDSLAWQVQGLVGTILCKMCTFLSDISLSVSTQSLAIIAVERFLAVAHPVMTRSITANVRRLIIASTWIVAMAIHAPYLYAVELVKDNEGNIMICQNKWINDDRSAFLRYNIFLLVTVLLIPLIAISILYPVVVVYIRRDKMAAYRSTQGTKRSRKRTMKLFKLAVATVLLLIICWVPYSVIFCLELFAPGTLPACDRIFLVIEYVSRVLASSYCAVNPVICFIFLRTFRGGLGILYKQWKSRASSKIDGKSRTRTTTGTGFKDSRIELLQMNVHSQTPSNSVQARLL